MKSVIFTSLVLALVVAVVTAAASSSANDMATMKQVASFSGEKASSRGKGRRGTTAYVAPVDERSLSSALELPVADAFASSDVSDGFEELELRIPDYDLPASDIPLTVNSKVEYFINYFQTRGRGWFAKWLSRSERYLPMMQEVLKKEGLPEDLVYLAMIESGFSTHAKSHASAV